MVLYSWRTGSLSPREVKLDTFSLNSFNHEQGKGLFQKGSPSRNSPPLYSHPSLSRLLSFWFDLGLSLRQRGITESPGGGIFDIVAPILFYPPTTPLVGGNKSVGRRRRRPLSPTLLSSTQGTLRWKGITVTL